MHSVSFSQREMASRETPLGLQQNCPSVTGNLCVSMPLCAVLPFTCVALSYCDPDLAHIQLSAAISFKPRKMSGAFELLHRPWQDNSEYQRGFYKPWLGRKREKGGNEAPGPGGSLGEEQRCSQGFFIKFYHVLCGIDAALRLPTAGGKTHFTHNALPTMPSLGKEPEANRSL